MSRVLAQQIARRALRGVGDAALGEWTEQGRAFHLRRRLSVAEAALVGTVRDIRDTDEERARLEALRTAVPPTTWALLRTTPEGR